MKRFILQSLPVILLTGLVWVFQNRATLLRRYHNSALRRDERQRWAATPRYITVEKTLPCGALGDVTVSFQCGNALPAVAAQNILDMTKRWVPTWQPVEKVIQIFSI
jgi:hypothetical protein